MQRGSNVAKSRSEFHKFFWPLGELLRAQKSAGTIFFGIENSFAVLSLCRSARGAYRVLLALWLVMRFLYAGKCFASRLASPSPLLRQSRCSSQATANQLVMTAPA